MQKVSGYVQTRGGKKCLITPYTRAKPIVSYPTRSDAAKRGWMVRKEKKMKA